MGALQGCGGQDIGFVQMVSTMVPPRRELPLTDIFNPPPSDATMASSSADITSLGSVASEVIAVMVLAKAESSGIGQRESNERKVTSKKNQHSIVRMQEQQAALNE
jgi:hypothetical protein